MPALQGRAILMGSSPCCRGNGWAWSPFSEPHGQHEQPTCLDRVRSCSYDLLCLCRRAAALCVGADVSWVLRHLETWRNPSDEDIPGALEFKFVSTLNWQIPQKPAQILSRRARAVLKLCHGDPSLSAPIRRRGAHVAPSCDLNAAFIIPKWTLQW